MIYTLRAGFADFRRQKFLYYLTHQRNCSSKTINEGFMAKVKHFCLRGQKAYTKQIDVFFFEKKHLQKKVVDPRVARFAFVTFFFYLFEIYFGSFEI